MELLKINLVGTRGWEQVIKLKIIVKWVAVTSFSQRKLIRWLKVVKRKSRWNAKNNHIEWLYETNCYKSTSKRWGRFKIRNNLKIRIKECKQIDINTVLCAENTCNISLWGYLLYRIHYFNKKAIINIIWNYYSLY